MAAKGGAGRIIGAVLIGTLILMLLVAAGLVFLRQKGVVEPMPGEQRCVGRAGDEAVAVDLDQAHFASIIVGISVRRGLPARAASIAIATVYQETGIRNLDYGDRDSVGLFQQRPSQGWGTAEQLMNPYYATNRFYDALVKIKDWESADITEVAQRIQISGYPDAYRQHESNARTLASNLAGHSAAGFSCLERQDAPGDAAGLVKSLKKTFRRVPAKRAGEVITIKARDETLAWAYANYALANSQHFGVIDVTVGSQVWRTDPMDLPQWGGATPALGAQTVKIAVRS